jgi:hypothetical protein
LRIFTHFDFETDFSSDLDKSRFCDIYCQTFRLTSVIRGAAQRRASTESLSNVNGSIGCFKVTAPSFRFPFSSLHGTTSFILSEHHLISSLREFAFLSSLQLFFQQINHKYETKKNKLLSCLAIFPAQKQRSARDK